MNASITLAERLRPQTLADLVGQEHLSGADGVLQKTMLVMKP
jgi:replication-associated recombination protein RarA